MNESKTIWKSLVGNLYQQKGNNYVIKEPEEKKYIPTQDDSVQICTVFQDPLDLNIVAALLYRPYFRKFYTDSKRHLESVEILRAAQHVGMAAYNKYFENSYSCRKYLALESSIRIKKQVNRTRCGLIIINLIRSKCIPRSKNNALLLKCSFQFINHKGEKCANGLLKSISYCSQ